MSNFYTQADSVVIKDMPYICLVTSCNLCHDVYILSFDMCLRSTSSIGDVQPLPWDSKDKAIFAMLGDICMANKQNPLSMSSNMATGNLVPRASV